MSYEDRIRKERSGMSRSFSKLADFLLDSYVEASFMTASELAHALNLDAATVVRFSQSLGYAGYPELQREIRSRVKGDLLIRSGSGMNRHSISGVTAHAMHAVIEELERTRISLDTGALETIVEQIGKSNRIIVLAEAPAQPAAYNLALFMEQGGFHVYTARTSTLDLARTIHITTPQDMIIAVDITGHNANITNALSVAREYHLPTAAIVAMASLPSARVVDMVLSAQSTQSVAASIVTVNALVYLVTEALRWRFADRFAGAEQTIIKLTQRIQENA